MQEFDLTTDFKNLIKPYDLIVQIMKNDPNLFVEINSHTDSRSSDGFNMTLSEKRAQAAVNYIHSFGIASKRLKGKGYGETKLVNNCSNEVECAEEEHAQNRRTEFRILRK